jgi:hypothetical protein
MLDSLLERAEAFVGKHDIKISHKLGFGWDGTVYSTSR